MVSNAREKDQGKQQSKTAIIIYSYIYIKASVVLQVVDVSTGTFNVAGIRIQGYI